MNAGALRAVVEREPWSLRLVDPRGRTVLAELSDTGAAPSGTVGFRTAAGWQHATRVQSSERVGGRYRAVLETTDPLHTIALELRPAGGGAIALDARVLGPAAGLEAVGMGFSAKAGERYTGFGERSDEIDQRGDIVENYVADGPYQTEEYPFLQGFVPPWALRDDREDATYFPVPWLLSSRGYGVLVDNPETSRFRLSSERADAWSVEVVRAPDGEAGAELAPAPDRLRLRFFAGPVPAAALRRMTAATGRQPAAAAPWVYGAWYQADDDEAAELQAFRDADVPVSVLQTYTHYLPCGDQQTEAERARVAAAHAAGVAITTYFNPMVCTNYSDAYEPAVAAGALTKTRAGTPYNYRYGASPDDLFVVGQYDFFSEAGRDAYASRLREAIGDGYDGWMEDFGEYTPLDSVSAGGLDGSRTHNVYPRRYHCTAHRAVRGERPAVVRFQRSGWTGAARCAQVVWGGDPTTAWGFDGLRSAVTQSLSIGMSGVGIWGSDIGGFFALGFNELSPELLTRWVQFGAVSGVMRTQANGVAVAPRSRPQVGDPDQLANWRRYTKLHTALYPYLLAAQSRYRRSGMPLMRHLMLVEPRDPRAVAADDEFLLGPDLLAAPVLEPGVTTRSLYLPRGGWVDLWRSARYRPGDGSIHLRAVSRLRGGREVTVPAPLDELPLMARVGAVLPLLPAGVDTLAPFGSGSPGVTGVGERRGHLRLLAFPRGSSRSAFGNGGWVRSNEAARGWALRIAPKRRTHIALEASLATLRSPFRPCAVSLDGVDLPRGRWSFDRRTGVLKARFATGGGTLKVRPGRCAQRATR